MFNMDVKQQQQHTTGVNNAGAVILRYSGFCLDSSALPIVLLYYIFSFINCSVFDLGSSAYPVLVLQLTLVFLWAFRIFPGFECVSCTYLL